MANTTQPPGLLERRKVEGEVTVSEVLANPAPLGLMGFGMTTVLLNIHNAGIYPLDTMILAMGIFYGGIAQIIAGLLEYRKGNTFGTTAFTSYGLFWLSLVALLVMPNMGLTKFNDTSFGFYLFMWGLFTCYMFVGTLKLNRALQVVFLSLTVLFWLLAANHWFGLPLVIAGVEGIFCGLSAIYAAMAQVLNECYGKTVLPLGFVKK
jgi:hypothetical protein